MSSPRRPLHLKLRMRYELIAGVSHLVYYPVHPAYAGWEILRCPAPAGLSAYQLYVYEVRKADLPYPGQEPFHHLREAREFVRKEGVPPHVEH